MFEEKNADYRQADNRVKVQTLSELLSRFLFLSYLMEDILPLQDHFIKTKGDHGCH